MLIELKRCNSIGNIDGLMFLISIIAGKKKVIQSEITNRCALEYGITVNCSGAVAFLQYLGYVDVTENVVIPNEKMDIFLSGSKELILNLLIKECIAKLVEEGIFDKSAVLFNVEKGHFSIKHSAFPLSHAAIRNFLTISGALEKEEHGEICIKDSYESDFIVQLQSRRNKFTLEELLKQQKEQSERGLAAEEFVLKLEKNRLPNKAWKIKRISDFDVSAGYDIVSFKEADSVTYDRYVEVKCYLGQPHFYWSENESEVAMIKGDKYVLCLVDYSRINEPGYIPE